MGILTSLVVEFTSYYKAILARSMFGMHATVAVWRTTVLMGVVYWSLSFGVFMLAMEYIVTMWTRMGEEWPWISPSTLCYLATTVASIWVQKLESLGHINGINSTKIATLPTTSLSLDFSAADWLLLTEQTMMVTIIISRWLLPKGSMTHKDLSSLLLLYLALSADILDFSTIFNHQTVATDKTFCYAILVIWTGSLFQFILVLTNTSEVDKEKEHITIKSIVCSSEIWQILVQIGLQDVPFLLIRLVAVLKYEVFNYTIIFFVCKNSLVISLELYHLAATCIYQHRRLKKRKKRMQQLKSKLVRAKDAIAWSKTLKLQPDDEKKNGVFGIIGKELKNNKNNTNTNNNNNNNTLALIAANVAKTKGDNDQNDKSAETATSTANKENSTSPSKESSNSTSSTTNDDAEITRSGSQLARENNKPVKLIQSTNPIAFPFSNKRTLSSKHIDGNVFDDVDTISTPPLSQIRTFAFGNRNGSGNRKEYGSSSGEVDSNSSERVSSIFYENDAVF